MMEQTDKTVVVAFRVKREQFERLEKAAGASGAGVNDWCREVVLERVGYEHQMTKNERLLYEELSRVRFLVGHGFRLLLEGEEGTAQAWEEARSTANHKAAEIADQLLAKSRTSAQV